jgi:hypothetical protein
MRSIKPGRGPSAMGALGSVAVGIFGVFWTIGAASMGAPPLFTVFGIVFVVMAIIQGLFHMKNATGKNRMSTFDITENHEETDPLNRYFGSNQQQTEEHREEVSYCPYCGNKKIDTEHQYCAKCGKELKS